MKRLTIVAVLFLLSLDQNYASAQTTGWLPIETGFSENLNTLVKSGNNLVAAGNNGRYLFFHPATQQMTSGFLAGQVDFLSGAGLRKGSNGMRICLLNRQNKIFSPDTLNQQLLEDTLPEMPGSEESATALIDLNITGTDQMRYGFTRDSGRILACKIPYNNTRFDIQLPFQGSINDLAAFASWGVLAVGDSGRIWRTAGLDQNFQSVSQLFHTETINALISKGSTGFWAAGNNGKLLKSNNSGSSWSAIAFPVEENLLGGIFSDSSLFIYTDEGKIFRSINEGGTWQQEETIGGNSAIRKMLKATDSNLYCVGDQGKFLKRGMITSNMPNGNQSVSRNLSIEGQRIFNKTKSEVSFLLSDLTGRTVISSKIPSEGIANIPEHLHGVFILRFAAEAQQPESRRIVLNP